MAVCRPKPHRHEASTSLTQEKSPSILQPVTIICEPWMNTGWQHPHQTRQLNLYLPALPPMLVLPGHRHLMQQNFCHPHSLHFSNDPITRHLTSLQKRPISNNLQLLHYTNPPGQPQQDLGGCRAGCRTRSITVECMHFDAIDIIACPCFPAPLQLLYRSLFPCAPVTPSLTVDLRIIEFVHLLFVRQSPNQTAWCDAVETFLDGMGYKLSCKGQAHLPPIDQPSEYLCSRCLLCFGGNTYHRSDDHSIPDIIICIDACFTQKCSTNPHGADSIDPPNPTPMFFLSNDNVKAMEDFIQSCHGERHRARASRAEGDEDHYEEGMHVPVSVLNGCGESFVAADEKREKASLMALLCRHDCVLWLVNLTSVGEKHHYALTLLDRFFKHLPPWMTIGLLYDIGKREGFGLSDGKGCERLWSSLKQLIPSLQVSGTKKNAALDSLLDLDIDEDMLRAEWKAQIAHQTRPTPRQSKNKAAEVITTILALEKTLDAYEISVHELKMQLYVGSVSNIAELNLQLSNAQLQRAKTADTLRCCKAALGMQEKADLEKMKSDTYLTVRLNAHAAKICIRDHLPQCKFELERLGRLYRATVNEPGVLKLVSTYNGLCTQLRSLIRQQRAPPSAVPPRPIIREGIFLLDINDEIWQDIGLDEDGINPPAWLLDEATRSGIHLQLEVDRCVEEETHLMRERTIMQEWMFAEWEAIQTVLRDAGMSSLSIQ
ncbi:uncharacterized protein EDB91DRAFT_1238447 [Suillus paluster]|uniref:uncharacterized protein n=1 Tax=Suillus paluster TaxID=48578 RepID=UPI001B86B0E1|nr:uncharacterized protein EDB91DRAFT_1238447 [Suillus paluster]KAG1734248.1 hypothetical protein EDB91DRAFT_1238447 [Suillus paluster]